jgi:hypothetical protein
MAKVTDPWKNPRAWETVVLNGRLGIYTLPDCTVTVRAGGVKEGEADVPGRDGVSRTMLGYKDAEASVTTRAANYAELEKLQKAIEAYRSKRGRPDDDALKLEVIHPAFTLNNIKHMYIFDFSIGDFSLEDGVEITLELREWYSEYTFDQAKADERIKARKEAAAKKAAAAKAKKDKEDKAKLGALPGPKPKTPAKPPPKTPQAAAARNLPSDAYTQGLVNGGNKALGALALIGGR